MSIIKDVTLQKIVAHDFRYDPRILCSTTLRGTDAFPYFSYMFLLTPYRKKPCDKAVLRVWNLNKYREKINIFKS